MMERPLKQPLILIPKHTILTSSNPYDLRQ